MSISSRLLALWLAFCAFSGNAFPQASPQKAADAGHDYSKEAFVVEEDTARIAFENDGTGTREGITRVRIQSDAGVQRYGVLTFSYEDATEKLDIAYVRVRKPDRSGGPTPPRHWQALAQLAGVARHEQHGRRQSREEGCRGRGLPKTRGGSAPMLYFRQ